MNVLQGRRRFRRTCLAAAVSAMLVAGCSTALSRSGPDLPACDVALSAQVPVRWVTRQEEPASRQSLAWCAPLGPPAVAAAVSPPQPATRGGLLIVNWNVAVGAGDVERLVRTLSEDERRAGRGAPELVLLLQEAYRTGPAVPASYAPYARFPRRIANGSRQSRDVESLAARLGMHLAYVPSMRNGGGAISEPAEDRGNAILSTLPLEDVTAIELPFENQRRVAVAATVVIGGDPVTVVTTHLDNRAPWSRGSIFAGPRARQRQAAALLDALDHSRIIVGGDFNTLAGGREPAIRVMEQRFMRVSCGSAITHQSGLALDYLFTTDTSLVRECRRARDRFDSDHHPLVARVL